MTHYFSQLQSIMWLQYWNSKLSHASFHWKSCETLPFQYCSLHKAFKTDIQPNTSRHSKQTCGTTWWCPYLQPPLGETTAILVASTAVPHPTQSEIRPTGTVLSQCVKASGWERGKMEAGLPTVVLLLYTMHYSTYIPPSSYHKVNMWWSDWTIYMYTYWLQFEVGPR